MGMRAVVIADGEAALDGRRRAFGACRAFILMPVHRLSQVASGGAGPVYLSLTPDGKHLLVANYVSGSIAVLPVQEDGSLAERGQLAVLFNAPRLHHAFFDLTGGIQRFAIARHG